MAWRAFLLGLACSSASSNAYEGAGSSFVFNGSIPIANGGSAQLFYDVQTKANLIPLAAESWIMGVTCTEDTLLLRGARNSSEHILPKRVILVGGPEWNCSEGAFYREVVRVESVEQDLTRVITKDLDVQHCFKRAHIYLRIEPPITSTEAQHRRLMERQRSAHRKLWWNPLKATKKFVNAVTSTAAKLVTSPVETMKKAASAAMSRTKSAVKMARKLGSAVVDLAEKLKDDAENRLAVTIKRSITLDLFAFNYDSSSDSARETRKVLYEKNFEAANLKTELACLNCYAHMSAGMEFEMKVCDGCSDPNTFSQSCLFVLCLLNGRSNQA
jgi:hypothetical protein